MKTTGCEVKKCECKNIYQDAKYGNEKRVWNNGPKRDKCTVCGKVNQK